MSPLLTDFDENLSVYRAYQSEENQVSSAGDTRVSKLAVLWSVMHEIFLKP